ncbi:arginyltransferase [Entomomonas asaccharolytica]|uniref:Aspartate/glutamate leucyltransferase n=1 Tax=Entomomonas asaccharolytica TaxID=2785331 RepID=A0A974NDM0_9GAMM|nr:arginyltransferase [Entomomonas asaccharolytica]QQP84629.1 arginyltransferase [Entomomonas asaccharolytica]
MKNDLANINLYLTDPHPCSYLTDQQASTVFVDPNVTLTKKQYTELSSLGFRRSGSYVYQPHCATCHACIAVRVVINQFKPNRQQKRIIRYNQDLQIKQVRPQLTKEYFWLYERYIGMRHKDGDMYPATREQYQSFLVDAPDYCSFYEFRKEGQLLAVAVVDLLQDSLSAVYTFFEPLEHRRSLGQYAILWQIEECKRLGLSYLSLGYWIKNCRKMSYKLQYRSSELFINQRWVRMD